MGYVLACRVLLPWDWCREPSGLMQAHGCMRGWLRSLGHGVGIQDAWVHGAKVFPILTLPLVSLPSPMLSSTAVQAGGFDEKVFLTSINDAGTLGSELAEPEA